VKLRRGSQATIKSRFRAVDGKLGLIGDRGLVGFKDDQLVHKVVQGGSEIVHDFPDVNTPHEWHWFATPDGDEQLPAIRVILGLDGIAVSFSQSGHFSVQCYNLLERPVDLVDYAD
jgi:hypothetical protein